MDTTLYLLGEGILEGVEDDDLSKVSHFCAEKLENSQGELYELLLKAKDLYNKRPSKKDPEQVKLWIAKVNQSEFETNPIGS